nr:MAG TPA: hypothetical protein [Caudoviricetes sp.]
MCYYNNVINKHITLQFTLKEKRKKEEKRCLQGH